MAKKKIIKKEFTPSPKNEKDTVVFMAVYDIHKIKRRFFRFRKRKKKGLWSQFHIAGFSHNNAYITPYAKCHYTVEYNSLNQVTAFHFEKSVEQYNKNFTDEMISTLYLQHSAKALLDSTLIELNTCFNLENIKALSGTKN